MKIDHLFVIYDELSGEIESSISFSEQKRVIPVFINPIDALVYVGFASQGKNIARLGELDIDRNLSDFSVFGCFLHAKKDYLLSVDGSVIMNTAPLIEEGGILGKSCFDSLKSFGFPDENERLTSLLELNKISMATAKSRAQNVCFHYQRIDPTKTEFFGTTVYPINFGREGDDVFLA